MYLNMQGGQIVWTSKRQLSARERCVLQWKFYKGSSARSALIAWFACLSPTLGLVALGLADWWVALVVLATGCAIPCFVLGILGNYVAEAESEMRSDKQFRFRQMRDGAPSFDLSTWYCQALRVKRVFERYPHDDIQLATRAVPVSDDADVDGVIEKWLEDRWLDDRHAVHAELTDDPILHARFYLGAIERAIESFDRLGLPTVLGYGAFCAELLESGRDFLRGKLEIELRRATGVANEANETVRTLRAELDKLGCWDPATFRI